MHQPTEMLKVQRVTTRTRPTLHMPNGRRYHKVRLVCPECQKERLMMENMFDERTFLVCNGRKQERKNGVF
jgi:hypothetical protein